MMAKLALNRKLQLGFGLAILAFFIVGAVSYRAVLLSTESERWVQHTHEVLENLQDLLLSIKSVESSARGFVLFGEDSYLESFAASERKAHEDVQTIGTLTSDEPAQQRRMSHLEAVVAQKLHLSES